MDMSKAKLLVSEASNLSARSRIFRDPQDPEILVINKTYLIKVDNDAEGVTNSEDNDNPHQDHGDALVPLLSAGGLPVHLTDVGDGFIDQAVGDDQNHEGKECHKEEVSKEYIILDVARIFPQVSEADRILLGGGVDHNLACFE